MKDNTLRLIRTALKKGGQLDNKKTIKVFDSIKKLEHCLKIKNSKKAWRELDILTKSILDALKS